MNQPSNYRNNNRVRLRVMGISYSQIQSGAYALILAQTDGPYRIPVVVGASEAQAIAIKMEGIIPPRPMTHDLFASICHAFHLELKEVFIHTFADGIFSSDLVFMDLQGNEVIIDARTSDAIAIAMRTQSPIFTTPEILEETGFIMEIKDSGDVSNDTMSSDDTLSETSSAQNPYSAMNSEKLTELMQKHIQNEEYELAAKIKAELAAREKSDEDISSSK